MIGLLCYLETLPTDRKKVLFIDEMPRMDTQRSNFVNALENFWNGWANRRRDIVLIATGSATSWMADKIQGHTFITTYGVVDGKHKSIVHSEVTMSDLAD